MCGIAGFAWLNAKDVLQHFTAGQILAASSVIDQGISRMLDNIAARGRDAFGYDLFTGNDRYLYPNRLYSSSDRLGCVSMRYEKPFKEVTFTGDYHDSMKELKSDSFKNGKWKADVGSWLFPRSDTPQKSIMSAPTLIGLFNFRGVPTTEADFRIRPRGGHKHFAVQPYNDFNVNQVAVSLTHNGQISNSDELIKACYGENEVVKWGPRAKIYKDGGDTYIDSYAILAAMEQHHGFMHADNSATHALSHLKGSFAIAAFAEHSQTLVLARNYLGLHYGIVWYEGIALLVWASTAWAVEQWKHLNGVVVEHVEMGENMALTLPMNGMSFGMEQLVSMPPEKEMSRESIHRYLRKWAPSAIVRSLQEREQPIVSREYAYSHSRYAKAETSKVVVVCSGGLDSSVTAWHYAKQGYEVHLLHFKYRCRAENNEHAAVTHLAKAIKQLHRKKKETYSGNWTEPDVVLHQVNLDWLAALGNSSLTDSSKAVAEGDAGAETPNEWVPARNLAMIGIAAAYCDAKGIGLIALGLNREESGSYKDNSTEFFESLAKPLSLGTQVGPRIECPLGNMMKSHIVKYGVEIGAPLGLTWSCYHGNEEGEQCGRCGPCLNFRRACAMAGIEPPVKYAKDALPLTTS